jgi:hypothetical protein
MVKLWNVSRGKGRWQVSKTSLAGNCQSEASDRKKGKREKDRKREEKR